VQIVYPVFGPSWTAWKVLLKALFALPMDDGETALFTLKNRVQIEMATVSFRVTRGYSFAGVLCDETN
jgi:hypothetical protein